MCFISHVYIYIHTYTVYIYIPTLNPHIIGHQRSVGDIYIFIINPIWVYIYIYIQMIRMYMLYHGSLSDFTHRSMGHKKSFQELRDVLKLAQIFELPMLQERLVPCRFSPRWRWLLGISCYDMPSGKHTKNYGKSPFFMGKSTINGHFQ